MGTNGLGKKIAFITASWLAARNSSTSEPCSQSATWIAWTYNLRKILPEGTVKNLTQSNSRNTLVLLPFLKT